jgi:hypothetical protein
MNNELEGVWKEAAVVQLKLLSRHLLGEAEEHRDNRLTVCPVRDSNSTYRGY